jgi:hypothetical protein
MSARWLAAAFAVALPWFANAQQHGMIDANVTIFVSNPSLIKSQTTVSYLELADVHCVGANCIDELSGNHRIFESSMVAGIHFRTSRWQYRGTLTAGGSPNECYYGQVDDIKYYYQNPPANWNTNGRPYLLAEYPEMISESKCTSGDNSSTCLQGQLNCNPSPVMISLRGGYDLTSAARGVVFDIDDDGLGERVAWTAPGSDVALLSSDRNGNGRIDSGAELFGDHTRLTNGTLAENGFAAIADLDANGDERVDASDPAWQDLILWTDNNHDGVSQDAEMLQVSESRIVAVGTQYVSSRRKDHHGNEFRYRGEVFLAKGSRKCYDVYLTTLP